MCLDELLLLNAGSGESSARFCVILKCSREQAFAKFGAKLGGVVSERVIA